MSDLAALREALAGSDRHVRLEALEGLKALGPAARPALPDVLAQLGSDWPKLCRRAARAVQAILPPGEAVLALANATRSAGEQGRQVIGNVLEEGPLPPETLAGLRALAGDASPAARLQAVRLLGRLALSGQLEVAGPATEAVVNALADADAEVAGAAWGLVGRLVEERAGAFRDEEERSSRLRGFLGRADGPALRALAVSALPLAGEDRGLVIGALRDEAAPVREAARQRLLALPWGRLLGLWREAGPGAELALLLAEGLLGAEEVEPAALQEALVRHLRREDLPLVRGHLLHHPRPEVRRAAVGFLAECGLGWEGPAAVADLVAVLRADEEVLGEPPTNRRAAAEALGGAERAPVVVSALVDALFDRDRSVRRAAAGSLGRLHGGVPEHFADCLARLWALPAEELGLPPADLPHLWELTGRSPRVGVLLAGAMVRRLGVDPPVWTNADNARTLHRLAGIDEQTTADGYAPFTTARLLFEVWRVTGEAEVLGQVLAALAPSFLHAPVMGPQWAVHVHALRGVARECLGPADVPHLARWFADPDALTRLAAVDWLGEVDPRENADAALPGLLALLEGRPDDRYLRAAVVRTLCRWGARARSAVPALRDLGDNAEHPALRAAAELLAWHLDELDPASGFAGALLAGLRSGDPARQHAAVSALERWGALARRAVQEDLFRPHGAASRRAWLLRARPVLTALRSAQRGHLAAPIGRWAARVGSTLYQTMQTVRGSLGEEG